jgi:hypothetical protein
VGAYRLLVLLLGLLKVMVEHLAAQMTKNHGPMRCAVLCKIWNDEVWFLWFLWFGFYGKRAVATGTRSVNPAGQQPSADARSTGAQEQQAPRASSRSSAPQPRPDAPRGIATSGRFERLRRPRRRSAPSETTGCLNSVAAHLHQCVLPVDLPLVVLAQHLNMLAQLLHLMQ